MHAHIHFVYWIWPELLDLGQLKTSRHCNTTRLGLKTGGKLRASQEKNTTAQTATLTLSELVVDHGGYLAITV